MLSFCSLLCLFNNRGRVCAILSNLFICFFYLRIFKYLFFCTPISLTQRYSVRFFSKYPTRSRHFYRRVIPALNLKVQGLKKPIVFTVSSLYYEQVNLILFSATVSLLKDCRRYFEAAQRYEFSFSSGKIFF